MSGTDGFGGEGAYIRLVASGGAVSGYVSVPGTAAADTSVGALKAVLCAEGGPANASILRGVAVEPESVRVCVLGRELHDDDETLGSATRRIAASTPLGVLDQDTIDAALGGPTGLFDVVVLAPLMAGVGARADEGFVVAASGHAARVPPIEALFPIAFAPPPPEPEPEPPNKFAVMTMPVDEERLAMCVRNWLGAVCRRRCWWHLIIIIIIIIIFCLFPSYRCLFYALAPPPATRRAG